MVYFIKNIHFKKKSYLKYLKSLIFIVQSSLAVIYVVADYLSKNEILLIVELCTSLHYITGCFILISHIIALPLVSPDAIIFESLLYKFIVLISNLCWLEYFKIATCFYKFHM